MTDNENTAVTFTKRATAEDALDGPMPVTDWMCEIFKQIRVANPECFDPEAIDYDQIERILQALAYYGIWGEEPRRRP